MALDESNATDKNSSRDDPGGIAREGALKGVYRERLRVPHPTVEGHRAFRLQTIM